jgi:hypothetical protein
VLRRIYLGLTACLVAACSDGSEPTEPVSGLPHAAASNSCGPADGPAVVIYLASMPIESLQPVAPFLQIHIWRSITELDAGSVIRISESISDANASFHGSGVEMKTANDGEVGVTSKSTTVIAGYVDLRFPDGPRFRGTFSAAWEPRNLLLCG